MSSQGTSLYVGDNLAVTPVHPKPSHHRTLTKPVSLSKFVITYLLWLVRTSNSKGRETLKEPIMETVQTVVSAYIWAAFEYAQIKKNFLLCTLNPIICSPNDTVCGCMHTSVEAIRIINLVVFRFLTTTMKKQHLTKRIVITILN